MQEITHVEIAVNPSTFGELEDTELKILIKTRNKVTRSVIRPGIICGSIRKLAYEITKQMTATILHYHTIERATNCISKAYVKYGLNTNMKQHTQDVTTNKPEGR